ncbi:MAG TPA: DUF1269 domain-containing protein [Caldilineae bacterium]|nr:DUF1269 domain-containing protein [Caldilineae bacterium]
MTDTTDATYKFIVAAFPHEDSASLALESLLAARKAEQISFEDAAVIRRSEDGKLHIKDIEEMSPGRAAAIGGAIGAAIGLLAGPAGVVVGGATGAWIGGIAAATTDTGFPDVDLKLIGELVKPGCSALVALTSPEHADALERMLVSAGSRLLTDSDVEGAQDAEIECGDDEADEPDARAAEDL